jgi:VWFA-related protein
VTRRWAGLAWVCLLSAASAPCLAQSPSQGPPAPPRQARPAQPSQPQPTPAPSDAAGQAFPAEVELVTVDAVVVDKKGEAVPGFTRDDFVVSDNGKPQAVTSFEAVTMEAARQVNPLAARPSYSTNERAAPPGRTFVLFFDDIHLTSTQAFRAKATVSAFLERAVAQGDTVILVASSGSAWWQARMPEGRDQLLAVVKRLDGRYVPDPAPDRVTEYEAMRIVVYEDQEVAWKVMRRFDAYTVNGQQTDERGPAPADVRANQPGMTPFIVRDRAEYTYRLATNRNKVTLEVMERAIRSLAGIRGRKAMILVSQGFIHDTQLDELRNVVDASRRVNVPVYFVDTRGLVSLPGAFTAEFGRPVDSQDAVAVLADITRDAEGSEGIALDTGGFAIKNSNDLAGGMARVASESRTYYLLGYTPPDLTRDGKFRKIEVSLTPQARLRAKGLEVRARRGYYAPLDRSIATKAAKPKSTRELPEVVRALDSPFQLRDIPLRASALVFDETGLNQMSVTLATEIDVRDVAFREEEGRSNGRLAFVIEAQHRETGEYYRYDQTIEMSLLPETRRQLGTHWYQVLREFTLPVGGYQAKIVVRDMAGGRMGSVLHEFEVPAGGALRISTPLLSDSLDKPASAAAAPKPVLRVRPAVASGATLYCQFGVFGAKREESGTPLPRVTSSYEIRRSSDGTVFRRSTPSVIKPTSVGSLLRLVGIPLAGAEPGEYEIVLQVTDELAGTRVEARERFVVEAAARKEGP